jgi:hypothetical protein
MFNDRFLAGFSRAAYDPFSASMTAVAAGGGAVFAMKPNKRSA